MHLFYMDWEGSAKYIALEINLARIGFSYLRLIVKNSIFFGRFFRPTSDSETVSMSYSLAWGCRMQMAGKEKEIVGNMISHVKEIHGKE